MGSFKWVLPWEHFSSFYLECCLRVRSTYSYLLSTVQGIEVFDSPEWSKERLCTADGFCLQGAKWPAIWEMFACENRNPGFWNSEFSPRNPDSRERLQSGICWQGMRNPLCGIENTRLSSITLWDDFGLADQLWQKVLDRIKRFIWRLIYFLYLTKDSCPWVLGL